ncbi:MAG: leucine-rich repeat domain-containing protein [Mycoplasma sp.]
MKLKTLFKAISGLAIGSCLIPVGMSFNNKALSLSNQNVGNFHKNKKNDEEVLANFEYKREEYLAGYVVKIEQCSNKNQATKVITKIYGSNPATSIFGNEVFENSPLIKTVEIEWGQTVFGKSCFANCTSLKSVNFTKNGGSIGTFPNFYEDAIKESAFKNCVSLTDIYGFTMNLNNLNFGSLVNNKAFSGCNDITIHYTIQDGDDPEQVLQAYHNKFDNTGAKSYTYVATNPPGPTPGPTPTPSEDTNNLGPILGGVFGGIVVVGLTTGGITIYKKKRAK